MAAVVFAPPAWRWTSPGRGLWLALGAALVAIGLGFAVSAMRELGPNLSPFPRPRRDAVLVTTGAFAYARHPIYGGLIVAASGWALWRGSGLHLLLAAVLALYMNAKASHEETLLLARFEGYAAYRAGRKRLIPWIF
jgi:protein-S-isoprenylcysteine O-methyltransferase Ste14